MGSHNAAGQMLGYLYQVRYALKASDKRSSMKKRLLERQKQVSQQAPPKDQKPKHKVQEL